MLFLVLAKFMEMVWRDRGTGTQDKADDKIQRLIEEQEARDLNMSNRESMR